MLGDVPVCGTVTLSKDGAMRHEVVGNYQPIATWAQLIISDNAGSQLASVYGTVLSDRIVVVASAAAVSTVPHGAKFKLFIGYPGDAGPTLLQYGTVIRREP